MALEAGYGYVMGRLGRDWESKEVKGAKVIYSTSLAYQLKKDDETVWVNLTVWPDDLGDSDGPIIAGETHKGDTVIVRGTLKWNTFTKQDGSEGGGWNMSCWQVGKVIRRPYVARPEGVQVPPKAEDKPAPKYELDEMEPF